MTTKARPGWGKQPGSGGEKGAGNAVSRGQHTTEHPEKQGPSGTSPAYLRGDLIMVEGRHLCSVHNGELLRSFDRTREMYRGGVYFRLDVLTLAQDAGCTRIVCTDRTTGTRYRTALANLLGHGVSLDHPKFGVQRGWPLDRWELVLEPGAARQLALFGDKS